METQLNKKTANITGKRPIKILQFGEGNFLRAFVDWMIDILNEQTDFNGNVQIIQPIPEGRIDDLNKQDGLYHVLLQGLENGEPVSKTRLITSVHGGMNPYDDFQAFLSLAENPDLQFIVSNTTEAGIAYDSTDTSADKLSNSFPGKMTALLHHRFQHFNGDPQKGLTIIPCELIDRNGDHLKNYILRYAEEWELDPSFIDWINENLTFCNTLVDRIVPGYPAEQADKIKKELGYDDKLLVKGEYFHLWIIEGPESIQEQLPFHQAGLNVKFVDDLSAYRTRKVRILNGLHTSMVPVGYLYGLRTVREAVEDEVVGNYLNKALHNEIIPTLDLSADELSEFANAVLERFKNPYIRHELSAIALNSVSKYKVRVLPSVLQYIEQEDDLPHRLLIALAALIRFYKGTLDGEKIPVNDSEVVVDFMKEAWNSGDYKAITQKILRNADFWDQDLTAVENVSEVVADYLDSIDTRGMKSVLK